MTTQHGDVPEPHATGPEPWPYAGPIHPDLLAAKALLYDPSGFACSRPEPEAESAEYGAYVFILDGLSVRFRAAKTTPTKVGQFATVWKRSPDGPIQPFDVEDPVDLFVISTREDDEGIGHFGQFVFSRQVLRERGILARNGSGGKRAFRVYPPWTMTANRQAGRTQTWQLDHFLHLTEGEPVDSALAHALYHP
ncbi:MepB family protein [Streptomyces sp. A5-4]|uniref:MepB family protein n=1 Tax=Streptomyces sp. A5-4 TaxID=3384771 RepID=UPI003DA80AF9